MLSQVLQHTCGSGTPPQTEGTPGRLLLQQCHNENKGRRSGHNHDGSSTRNSHHLVPSCGEASPGEVESSLNFCLRTERIDSQYINQAADDSPRFHDDRMGLYDANRINFHHARLGCLTRRTTRCLRQQAS
jgi:hypothetical protein